MKTTTTFGGDPGLGLVVGNKGVGKTGGSCDLPRKFKVRAGHIGLRHEKLVREGRPGGTGRGQGAQDKIISQELLEKVRGETHQRGRKYYGERLRQKALNSGV